ncbi:right-handed parallel beta-helix repeat-containing protein [Parabacteroides chongii]|uniref:right-handed parallel beta-helix repeat-containing protein n=1 Tax=Parabacteroides chongii TaxID=2685834 RepID=UPI00240E8969|nr:right-handed parallel beta-helix repeat-containing protein [Parabacteroides chongii]WFE87003.1 right-handed parallel beta-helix repeat-containing protein [Parabacteroides chongii]
MKMKFIVLVVFILQGIFVHGKSESQSGNRQTTIIVKPGSGTLQQAIRKAASLEGDVIIEMKGGEYRTDKTIEIQPGKWSSLLIKAREGEMVSVSGDKVIPLSRIRQVKDRAILSRLQESVRGKVVEVDCKGIVETLANIRPSGFGRKSLPAWSELMIDNEPLHLSRWPNDSMALIGRVDVSGGPEDKKLGRLPVFHYQEERPAHWKNTDNMWIGGYFGYGYADDMIPVKSVNPQDSSISVGMFTTYQFFTGADFRRWFALNLPEEIDRTGEYVIDPDAKKFYFLPGDQKITKVRLTVLDEPVIAVENCENVTIEGITIENSRGIGVYMDNTENVLLQGCTIRNVGNVGVCIGKGTDSPKEDNTLQKHAMEAGGELCGRMVGDMMGKIYENSILDRQAGRNNGVKDCYIYNTGAGGVSLGGGNRVTLTRSDNYVENCKISRYNRIEKSYRPGVWIDGVGNRVTKCDISDAPSMAILFHGNEHTIEYCDITQVCQEVDDQGAIYYGRDPSERGNVIRYNYFHELSPRHRVTATYHDDGACGSEVYGNIYFKAGSLPVLIGGGMDHKYYNNIFIDSPTAIHLDNRLQNWASNMVNKGDIYDKRLQAVNYTQPPYSVKYPELVNYWQEDPAFPKRNRIYGNLFYNITNLLHGSSQWGEFWNNWTTNEDPGFVDPADPLKGFRKDAPVFKRIAGFKDIPYTEIGSTLK